MKALRTSLLAFIKRLLYQQSNPPSLHQHPDIKPKTDYLLPTDARHCLSFVIQALRLHRKHSADTTIQRLASVLALSVGKQHSVLRSHLTLRSSQSLDSFLNNFLDSGHRGKRQKTLHMCMRPIPVADLEHVGGMHMCSWLTASRIRNILMTTPVVALLFSPRRIFTSGM